MDVRRIGHYDIVQQLGAGGMGEVFLAEDSRLGRRVALKVLPEAMAADPDRLERFETEARVVAGLNHPGIVTLHSLERHGETSYLTMEFVDGDTLSRLMQDRLLTVAEAQAFVTEVAAALAAAHAQGITHRDVKPANIMRTTDGRAKILDFGLARLHEESAGPAEEEDVRTVMKTQDGLLLGTIDYMAPEQALGRPVDPRSDMFSLGIVMYQLVSGKHPFPADSINERLAAIIRDVPRPVGRVIPKVSGAFARAIDRCLCKEPERRFQKGSELADALNGAPVTLDDSAGRFRSVAVLPFRDLSERRDQEYFCDGIAEELADALNNLSGLRVASRTSAARFRNEAEDVRKIGELLDAESVVEGSLRLAGDRLRVSVRCTSTRDGYVVWSGRFDRVLDDVFEIQGDIAARVAQALAPEFLGDG